MKILFNPRENGACPYCTKKGSCPIREHLGKSVNGLKDADSMVMEIVIYACPQYVEKF